jgi:hypothetical protein
LEEILLAGLQPQQTEENILRKSVITFFQAQSDLARAKKRELIDNS